MIYSFSCPGKSHEGDRDFDRIVHGAPPQKVVSSVKCPKCGAKAARRLDREIPTQAVVGITPISHATTVKGSMAHTTEVAFGKFQENPDGSVDPNHRPFGDSGDLNRFMNGANNLGKPKMGIDGKPMRKKDGSIIREGRKLIKFSPGDTPSRDGVRKSKPRLKGV